MEIARTFPAAVDTARGHSLKLPEGADKCAGMRILELGRDVIQRKSGFLQQLLGDVHAVLHYIIAEEKTC